MAVDLQLRPTAAEDFPALTDITVRAFVKVSIDARLERSHGLLSGTSWGDRKWATVAGEIAANPFGCFTALWGDQIVGYITTAVDEASSVGRIINLAVDPDVHGQGIGKKLLCRAFDYFRERHVEHYRIETTTDNEVGQALYPRCGFHEITRQIIYFMSAAEAAEWTYDAGDKE